MVKLLTKQVNNDGTTTIVYSIEKNKVTLVTGHSPRVDSVKVVTKDKMIDELRKLMNK